MPARKKPSPRKPAVTASQTELRAALQREVARREKVERELTAQNQFVSAILDTVGALVAVVDRQGRIVRFNRTCEQTLGFTFAEVEGRPFWNLLPIAGEVEPARLVFERLLAGRWPASYETYWYTRDGTRRSLIWSTTFLNDAKGEVEYVIGTGVDVTEHRRAEQKAAALLDVVKDIGGTLDLDEILLRVERRMTATLPCDAVLTFYWDATRRVSRMISHYGLPEDGVAAAQTLAFEQRGPFAAAFTRGETVLIDNVERLDWFPAVSGDFCVRSLLAAPLVVRGRLLGSLIALSTSRRPFDTGQRDLCEGAARHLALAIEATDLYRTQQDEARIFSGLARVAQELIASLGAPALLDRLCELTTEVLECDYSHTWLWQPEEDTYVMMGTHGDPPEVREGIRVFRMTRSMIAPLLERLDRDGIVNEDMSHAQRSDLELAAVGTGITVGMQVPLRRGGEVVGIHTAGFRRPHELFTAQQERIGRGIAQLASLALENARLVDELGRANRLKSDFVATMSHELRTPLNVIVGYNDLLLSGEFGRLEAEQADILERMRRSSQQLLELINTTLDVSRLDSGRMVLELQDVNLSELVANVAAETQEQQERSGLRFTWEAPSVPLVRTDPLKLKVVMKNLVGNAIKFTENGAIAVAARANGDGVEITVVDTGIGMEPEVVAVIFEPFRQADGSIARRYGGAGLGLYIVRRLLQLLGGTIAVESTPGQGSTFRIQLPLARTLDPLA